MSSQLVLSLYFIIFILIFRMAGMTLNAHAKYRVNALPVRTFCSCTNIKLGTEDTIEHLQALLTTYPRYKIATLELEREEFDIIQMKMELNALNLIMYGKPAFSLILNYKHSRPYEKNSNYCIDIGSIPPNVSSLEIKLQHGRVNFILPSNLEQFSVGGTLLVNGMNLPASLRTLKLLYKKYDGQSLFKFNFSGLTLLSTRICW